MIKDAKSSSTEDNSDVIQSKSQRCNTCQTLILKHQKKQQFRYSIGVLNSGPQDVQNNWLLCIFIMFIILKYTTVCHIYFIYLK